MKIIRTGKEAQLSLKRGIDAVANAGKLTLGSSGSNAIIGRPYQSPLITNDGITIVKEFQVKDEIEQLGVDSVLDACNSANKEAGDGTTTTLVLTQAITDVGFQKLKSKSSLVDVGGDPMAIKREINDACKLVVDEIKKKARPVESLEDIKNVATISVESPILGEKIANMFHELGKDAVITTLDGLMDVEFETIKGLEINTGLISPNLANNNKGEYVQDNPLILVTDHAIESNVQLKPLIAKIIESGRKHLILISDSISKDMLREFVIANVIGIFTVIPLKVPTFNERKILEDYAAITGAKFIDRELYDTEDIELKDLGTCEKVIVKSEQAVFLGSTADTSERIEKLRLEEANSDSVYDKEQLKKRIGKLSGGIGIIRVGAPSDTDREYLKLKIEDAVNATRSAMEEGVVKGGGLTLMEISGEMKENILTEAIKSPYNQIQENAGGNLVIGENVLDPVKVTRTALEKACSVAGLIITTKIAIADKREDKKPLDD